MIQTYQVEANNYEDAGIVSQRVKQTLKLMNVPPPILKRIAIACYEGEINLVIHSEGGSISLIMEDSQSIKLKLDDVGPGIADIEQALIPGYSTASREAREFGFGAGMGLVNMKACASAFEISSSPNGTHICMEFRND